MRCWRKARSEKDTEKETELDSDGPEKKQKQNMIRCLLHSTLGIVMTVCT